MEFEGARREGLGCRGDLTPEPWLTTTAAAAMCGVHPDSITRWIKQGRLPAVRLPGGRWRVHEGDVRAVLRPARVTK